MYFELIFEGMAGRQILRTAQWHSCQLAEFISSVSYALAVESMQRWSMFDLRRVLVRSPKSG